MAMVNTLDRRHPTLDTVAKAHALATTRWWGCNWPTQFGARKLNLLDVRSRQARLIANATSGEESSAWETATQYLLNIENDASDAEIAAARAVSLVRRHSWHEALAAIDEAVALETKYRHSIVWQPVREEIAAGIE